MDKLTVLIEELIMHAAKKDGTFSVLKQIQARYGELTFSATPNYEELALSFLNIFDSDTQKNIIQSPWFSRSIQHRIPIHILYEELKAVQELLSLKLPEVLSVIEKLSFGKRYFWCGLDKFTLPSTILESHGNILGNDLVGTLFIIMASKNNRN